MPAFRVSRVVTSNDVSARRVLCDGCDPARPCDEHTSEAALWLVTAGVFELRDKHGWHVLDPSRAFLMPAGHGYRIRHPAGPDVCIALRGPLVDTLAATGARLVPTTSSLVAGITRAVAAGEPFSLAEALAELAVPIAPPARRDLGSAIADIVRLRYADECSLTELVEPTGYSVFHACRVFRAATGHTIHGFRRELRLRHALARILDGEPIGAVAASVGFASQSHLTNLFRARFGVTPARARTKGDQTCYDARADMDAQRAGGGEHAALGAQVQARPATGDARMPPGA